MGNHISIDPIRCFVDLGLLYADDPKFVPKNSLQAPVAATITAICLYKDDAPCFDLLLDDGSMFAYVPTSHIVTKTCGLFDTRLELKDLVYHNAKSAYAEWSVIVGLTQIAHSTAFLKHRDKWIRVRRYLGTLDWVEDNDLLHLVELENDQFAFLPSHKILFGYDLARGIPKFAKYKKQRNTWRV